MTEEELRKEAEEYDLVIRFKSNKPKYEIRSYIINHILDEFDNLQMWDFKRSGEFAEPREKRIEELETRCAELFLQNNEFAEQLTKAKEILKMIVNYYPCYNKTITEQAEQFLKENGGKK